MEQTIFRTFFQAYIMPRARKQAKETLGKRELRFLEAIDYGLDHRWYRSENELCTNEEFRLFYRGFITQVRTGRYKVSEDQVIAFCKAFAHKGVNFNYIWNGIGSLLKEDGGPLWPPETLAQPTASPPTGEQTPEVSEVIQSVVTHPVPLFELAMLHSHFNQPDAASPLRMVSSTLPPSLQALAVFMQGNAMADRVSEGDTLFLRKLTRQEWPSLKAGVYVFLLADGSTLVRQMLTNTLDGKAQELVPFNRKYEVVDIEVSSIVGIYHALQVVKQL